MTEFGYAEALAALESRGRFGIRLGLGRIRAILRELDDPQADLRGALVAGTNGKGSVLALCSSALRAAGLLVGETPKPHLVSYRERLVVDGRPVSPRPSPGSSPRGSRPPTGSRAGWGRRPSSLLTAVAFHWFAERRVEVAMVEVGWAAGSTRPTPGTAASRS
jgi:dihydrofolate synthase/folylpolyglutamate synthase